jgi:hypothetical protein
MAHFGFNKVLFIPLSFSAKESGERKLSHQMLAEENTKRIC